MGFFEKIRKNRQILLYLVFGVLTTAVNVVAYYLFAHPLSLSVGVSTLLAWLASVIFAFVTNKIFVFEARGVAHIVYELVTFFASRVLTGAIDMAIMLVFVEVLCLNDLVIKIVSNIVVIILNFILSKIIVFRGRK